MNLEILQPTRRRPRRGDLFVMRMAPRGYLFGRVVREDARIGPMGDCLLIYVYDKVSQSIDDWPPFAPPRLLLPPRLTNRQPWLRGYFKKIDSLALTDEQELPQHCFFDVVTQRYFDEYNRELLGPTHPVGEYGLDSYRTIDEELSEALDVPRSDGY